MHRFRLRGFRISPALVISMLALFVALCGHGLGIEHRPAGEARVDRRPTAKHEACRHREGRRERVQAQRPDGRADLADSGPGHGSPRNGQTAAQIAATPRPASSLPAGLFTIRSIRLEHPEPGRQDRRSRALLSPEKRGRRRLGPGQRRCGRSVDRPIPDGSRLVLPDLREQRGHRPRQRLCLGHLREGVVAMRTVSNKEHDA